MLVSHRHFLPVVAGLFLANIFPALGQEFPDGPGKQVVTAVCGGCHDINRIRIGYTPEGWRTVVRMMQNVETPVPADQWDSVTEYLIKSFPERPRPAAVVLSGPAGNGRCRHRVRDHMTRLPPGTEPFGGPASSPTSSDGSIQRPAR